MITLSLPNKWLRAAARRVVATSRAEFRKRYRRALWRQPFVWAALSHGLSLYVLAISLPAHDWDLSLVALLSFAAVSHYQGKVGR